VGYTLPPLRGLAAITAHHIIQLPPAPLRDDLVFQHGEVDGVAGERGVEVAFDPSARCHPAAFNYASAAFRSLDAPDHHFNTSSTSIATMEIVVMCFPSPGRA